MTPSSMTIISATMSKPTLPVHAARSVLPVEEPCAPSASPSFSSRINGGGLRSAQNAGRRELGMMAMPMTRRNGERRCRASCAGQRGGVRAVVGEDPFEALGVNRGASRSEIKNAYRNLVLKYHPDICKGDHCSPRFMQINAAYELALAHISGSSDSSILYTDGLHEDEGILGDSWEDWEADLDYASQVSMNKF